MPQTIDQWIFQKLNVDPTLAAQWGVPAENPYAIAAPLSRSFPYCVYQLLNKIDEPIYGDPAGIGNTWIYSFSLLSIGTDTMGGAAQVRLLANRLAEIMRMQNNILGVQFCHLVSRTEHWFEAENCYRVVMDYQIEENLCQLP